MLAAVKREAGRLGRVGRRAEQIDGDQDRRPTQQQQRREEIDRSEQAAPRAARAAEARGQHGQDQGVDDHVADGVDVPEGRRQRSVVADLQRIRRTRAVAARERSRLRQRRRQEDPGQAADEQHGAGERHHRASGLVEPPGREREDEPEDEERGGNLQQHADAVHDGLLHGPEAEKRGQEPVGDEREAVGAPRARTTPGQSGHDEDEHGQRQHEGVPVRAGGDAAREHDGGGGPRRGHRQRHGDQLGPGRPACRQPRRGGRPLLPHDRPRARAPPPETSGRRRPARRSMPTFRPRRAFSTSRRLPRVRSDAMLRSLRLARPNLDLAARGYPAAPRRVTPAA